MKKMPRRRFTDKIRDLADQAWARGSKELSESLHETARRGEATRTENTNG